MDGYRNLTDSEAAEDFESLITIHIGNIIVGSITSIINFILLFVLLKNGTLRKQYKLITVLCIGDTINCISIGALGLERYPLYLSATKDYIVPLETSITCAVKPYIWLRILGNCIPPSAQLLNGVERLTAAYLPAYYRKNDKLLQNILSILCIIYSSAVLIIGFLMSWRDRNNGYVKYYCGRKASFSSEYGTFIYSNIIFGYFFAFLFSGCLYISLVMVSSEKRSARSLQKHLNKLKINLSISFLSTLLVSIPNVISLFSAVFGRLDDIISEPSNWAAAINSSLNLFLYFWLNKEFRRNFLRTYWCSRWVKNSSVNIIHTRVISSTG